MKRMNPGLLIILMQISLACSGHTVHHVDGRLLEASGPISRGYVYQSRSGVMDAGDEPVEYGSPVVTASTVFVMSETRGVEALDRSSKKLKWSKAFRGGVSSQPLLDNNVLYFGTNDGHFYALNADSGKELWNYESRATVLARPTIVGNRIYLTSSEDVIYCLEKDTGKWVWHYRRNMVGSTTIRGNASPVIDDGLLYVGFSDGYVVALNAKDGQLKWESRVHRGTKFTDVDATVVLDGERLLVPSYDGELYALNKKKGTTLWSIDVGGSRQVLMDATDPKRAYLASNAGFIYAFDRESGRIQWKFELDEGSPTNLIQHQNHLAFGSSRQYFYAIHKGDGSLAYRYNAGFRSGFSATIIQSESDVFAFSNFGNLYVFQWKPGASLQ